MKEILIHLKPNNFPRYLDQLSELETAINAIDATKYNHASNVKVVTVEKEPDVMKEEVAITKEDIEKSAAHRKEMEGDEEEKGDEEENENAHDEGKEEEGDEEEKKGDEEEIENAHDEDKERNGEEQKQEKEEQKIRLNHS